MRLIFDPLSSDYKVGAIHSQALNYSCRSEAGRFDTVKGLDTPELLKKSYLEYLSIMNILNGFYYTIQAQIRAPNEKIIHALNSHNLFGISGLGNLNMVGFTHSRKRFQKNHIFLLLGVAWYGSLLYKIEYSAR